MGKKIPGEVLKYLVLESCKESPSYGYEIVSRIEDITDENWSPSYGTIYPLIQRLEQDSLIKPLSNEEAKKEDLETGDRKYFAITKEGSKTLEEVGQEERKEFERLIVGYLKVYEHVNGSDDLDRFLGSYE